MERFISRMKNILNLDSPNFKNLGNIRLKVGLSILAMKGMFLARLICPYEASGLKTPEAIG